MGNSTIRLSIVICSRHADISEELKRNIDSTIGLKPCVLNGCDFDGYFEIIVIDNSGNKYNIFSAYNEGIRRASGEIVCFMHEDVWFHSQDWGVRVINHFKNAKTGLIGVEGTHFMAKCASPWWSSAMNSGQLIQGNMVDGIYESKTERLWGRKCTDSINAVVVDGLWMCIRKSLFDCGLISFDEKLYSGFHCYDADICMQIYSVEYEVRIVFDILIEHSSLGNPDLYYFSQLDIWYRKWKDFLPLYNGVNMSSLDIEERNKICKNYTELFRNYEILNDRLNRIKKSNAYCLGYFLLKPLKFLKSIL